MDLTREDICGEVLHSIRNSEHLALLKETRCKHEISEEMPGRRESMTPETVDRVQGRLWPGVTSVLESVPLMLDHLRETSTEV